MRLSGPRSRPTAAQKNLATPGIEPGTPKQNKKSKIIDVALTEKIVSGTHNRM
jgi:hypothetical protein